MMGVRVLHSLGIIHRDIKPDNIFLNTQHNFARIGEFSRALLRPAPLTNKDGCSSECVGTRQYTAPEIIGGAKYGRMVDWWSVGCLLFEMITGQVRPCVFSIVQVPSKHRTGALSRGGMVQGVYQSREHGVP